MQHAARKYLRQVRRNLCCPRSIRRAFLRRLYDDLLLFCEEQDDADYAALVDAFGPPEETAADFFTSVDVRSVSRFAYNRLRAAYLLAAAVLVASTIVVGYRFADYVHAQQLVSNAQPAETYVHPNGQECKVFYLRTNFRGNVHYWEYHTCQAPYLQLTSPDLIPEEVLSEPYATDILLNVDGKVTHWHFGNLHRFWVLVPEAET